MEEWKVKPWIRIAGALILLRLREKTSEEEPSRIQLIACPAPVPILLQARLGTQKRWHCRPEY
jgi:hypothetical protein